MTIKAPIDGIADEHASRRRNARLTTLPFVVFLLILLPRQVRVFLGDVSEGLLMVGGVVLGVAVIYAVTVLLCNRKFRRFSALVGPGGWGAPCLYAANPQAWGAIHVDSAGVRLVGGSGVVVNRDWMWEMIRDVAVEQIPVVLRTPSGVVLHLADGSRAELLLPNGTLVGYPRARAEAAANEIRQRLEVFRTGSTPSGTRYR
jgi:hypothetical protein